MSKLSKKEEKLKHILANYETLAIAYSGGVDSTYLAAVSHEILGEKALLILADSASIPRSEVKDAVNLAKNKGWNLKLIETEEIKNINYRENTENRCYFCKSELFEQMTEYTKKHDIKKIAYGAIMDDLSDHRPGAVAAKEFSIVAPLQEAYLSKKEIRELSKQRNLPTSNKASFACLSSRFPTGISINTQKLSQVEQAEEILKNLGFQQFRARYHNELCRIEISLSDFPKILNEDIRFKIIDGIKSTGFKFITLDLAGYKTGSTVSRKKEL